VRHTVVHFIESAVFGGTERVLLQILAGLDSRRWRSVLAYHPGPGIAPLLQEARGLEIELRAVPRMDRPHDLRRLSAFIQMLRATRPAIFHAHLNWPLACKYGLAAAAISNVPAIVVSEHVYVPVPWRCSILLQRLLATRINRYIAVSREVAQRVRDNFALPAGKLQVIYNGIDVEAYDRPQDPALRRALAGAADVPIVLTIARLDAQKGLGYLMEAARLVPEAVFVVAGEGPERRSLEAQARQLGVSRQIVWLGYRDDIANLLACSDLFVLPSLYEGLPIALLEAMAAGRPVVASAIGGVNEVIVHEQNGLLVPPADALALVGAIRTLLADPALAQRLARAGRACVAEHFSVARMVAQLTDCYEDLVHSHGALHGYD
jgi:glycosyltransferase involved in cell wall biosynthesis